MSPELSALSITDLPGELARLNREPITPANAMRRATVVNELAKRATT